MRSLLLHHRLWLAMVFVLVGTTPVPARGGREEAVCVRNGGQITVDHPLYREPWPSELVLRQQTTGEALLQDELLTETTVLLFRVEDCGFCDDLYYQIENQFYTGQWPYRFISVDLSGDIQSGSWDWISDYYTIAADDSSGQTLDDYGIIGVPTALCITEGTGQEMLRGKGDASLVQFLTLCSGTAATKN